MMRVLLSVSERLAADAADALAVAVCHAHSRRSGLALAPLATLVTALSGEPPG